MRTFLLSLALLSSTASAAVPLELTHQGRLFDTAGDPLTGDHDLGFALYDAPAGGALVWSEDLTGVRFELGYYAVDLGQTTPLDLDVLQGAGALWVALRVDGAVELPQRLPLQSVPFALIAERANVASSVAGGPVDATSLTVNGTSVVAEDGTIAWERITGAPAQLGDLGCAQAGQIPQWSGSAWGCVNPAAHEHSADQITNGTLSLDVIPIGTSQNTVARGDHTHTALDLDLGPNAIDNPLNHDRYTDMEARAAVGQHYTDADAITAVGPHTPAYTDDMAKAAVGPHTPAYTDDMAIAAVGPHTPAYTDTMARAAVGPHTPAYTDTMARTAVGPHTPAYTDTMAIAAVGPHTPAYTDTMAIAAVGPHTPAYTDAMARTAVGAHYTDADSLSASKAARNFALSGQFFKLYGAEITGYANNPTSTAPHLNMTATRGNYIGSALFEIVGAPHCGYCYSSGPKALIRTNGNVPYTFYTQGDSVYVALDAVNSLYIRSSDPISPSVVSAIPSGAVVVTGI